MQFCSVLCDFNVVVFCFAVSDANVLVESELCEIAFPKDLLGAFRQFSTAL